MNERQWEDWNGDTLDVWIAADRKNAIVSLETTSDADDHVELTYEQAAELHEWLGEVIASHTPPKTPEEIDAWLNT